MSKTSPGPKTTEEPSWKSIPSCPEMMKPTCRITHHSPPTVGRTSFDQRQPGSFTRRPTVRSPRWTISVRTFGNSTISSGSSTLFRRTSVIRQSYAPQSATMEANAPALVVVDDDERALDRTGEELRRRYAADYRIVTDRSPEAALAELEQMAANGEDVAVVLADQWMDGLT